jgi:hypothetical protein
MNKTPRRIRAVLASLILATTTLFVVGVVIERSGRAEKPGSRTDERRVEEAESHAEEEGEASQRGVEEVGERLLGVDLESPALVGLAVVLSIGMAVAVLVTDRRDLLIAVAVAMLAFTLLDVREVAHQIREARAGLAALATVVTVGHLAAGALSMRAAARRATA